MLPYHLTHANHLPTPLLFNGTIEAITPLTSSSLLISTSSLTSPTDSFILNLADIDSTGDGVKPPRSPLHRLTDWSGQHIGSRLDDSEGEQFWFEGAEGWMVMGWALKPKGWKESDAKTGKIWPMGESESSDWRIG